VLSVAFNRSFMVCFVTTSFHICLCYLEVPIKSSVIWSGIFTNHSGCPNKITEGAESGFIVLITVLLLVLHVCAIICIKCLQ